MRARGKDRSPKGRLVMRAWLLLAICAGMPALHGWDSEEGFICSATNALTNRACLRAPSFTNELYAYRASLSSSNSVGMLRVSLLDAICFQEMFEEDQDASVLDEGLNRASNTVHAAAVFTNDCLALASRLVLAGGLCCKGKDGDAYSVCTNALAMAHQSCTCQSDVFIRSLLDYHDMPDLNVYDALKAFAGLTAANKGWFPASSNLVESLPLRYREMAQEIISGKSGE